MAAPGLSEALQASFERSYVLLSSGIDWAAMRPVCWFYALKAAGPSGPWRFQAFIVSRVSRRQDFVLPPEQ